jgi:hypothetical protein
MPPSEVRLIFGTREGETPAREFVRAFDSWLSLLREIDRAISQEPQATLRWVIADLGLGSPATVTLRPIPPERAPDVGPAVAEAYIGGMAQLEEGGARPKWFTDAALEAARKLATVSLNGDRLVRTQACGRTVTITERVSASARELVQTYTGWDSVEGRLEMVTLHGRSQFRVYTDIEGVGVLCDFPDNLLDTVKQALGQRVSVSGRVYVKREGGKQVTRLRADAVRVFHPPESLPKPADLEGVAPGFTGGLRSEDYVHKVWGDGG